MGAIGIVLGLLALLLSVMVGTAPMAFADEHPDPQVEGPTSPGEKGDTCDEMTGFEEKDETSPFEVSGSWGSLTATDAGSTATAAVKAGWTVDLCVKGGPSYNLYTVTCPPGGLDCADAVLSTPGGQGVSHIGWGNASFEEPEPTPGSFTLSSDCEDQSVTVTVTPGDDEEYSVDVTVNDGAAENITQTTTFPVSDGDQVSAVDSNQVQDSTTFVDDCTEQPVPTTASFEVEAVCDTTTPAATYSVEITQGDDPIDGVTLTFKNGDDVVETVDVAATSAANVLFAGLGGETLDVSWDFDGTTAQIALPDDCDPGTETETPGPQVEETQEPEPEPTVLGVVIEKDPAPAPTEVASEELPNAGNESAILAVLGGGFLAIGCLTLLLDERRRVTVAR